MVKILGRDTPPRSLVGVILIILCSCGINILLMLTTALVWPFNTALARRLISKWQAMWMDQVAYILPKSTLHISGDLPTIEDILPYGEKKAHFMIANHMVDADWYFLWMLARIAGNDGLIKIILKDTVRNMPVFGWGMQGFEFIFLARNWESDQTLLRKRLRSFIMDRFPLQLMIFPEGTTINVTSQVKGNEFAVKNGRPTFDMLISPRVRGMEGCMEGLRTSKPDILDCTICYQSYTGEIPTWDMGYSRKVDTDIPNLLAMLLEGKGCPNVYIHVERFPYDQVAANVEKFLDERWARKDALLKAFAKEGKFPDSATGGKVDSIAVKASPLSTVFLLAVLVLWLRFVYLALSAYPLYTILVVVAYVAYRHAARSLDWDYSRAREAAAAQ